MDNFTDMFRFLFRIDSQPKLQERFTIDQLSGLGFYNKTTRYPYGEKPAQDE